MDVKVRTQAGVDVLDFGDGAINAGSRKALEIAFKNRLDSGSRRFVFNMAELPYIDSPIIGETVACLKRAHDGNGDIKLVMLPDSRVERLYRLTALDKIFEIHADEKAAVGSFDH